MGGLPTAPKQELTRQGDSTMSLDSGGLLTWLEASEQEQRATGCSCSLAWSSRCSPWHLAHSTSR